MARLQCRACGFDDQVTWDGRLVCPGCGSTTDCRVAIATADIPDSVWERIEAALIATYPEIEDEDE